MRVVIKSGTFTRPADTTAYAGGDVATAVTTPVTMPFTGIPRIAGDGAIIQSAIITSSAAVATKFDCELWLFSSDITDIDSDNSAFTPTDAQMETLVGVIAFPVASWKGGDGTTGAGGNAMCSVGNIQIGIQSDNIYGVLIARSAYTPVASEKFTVKLAFVTDYEP